MPTPSEALRPLAAALLVACAGGLIAPLADPLDAQEPDTLAPPAARVPPRLPDPLQGQDTLPQDTTDADSLIPPPRLPRMAPAGPVGWAAGVWEWDRDALLRLPDVTLLQLLARVPGLTPVRPALMGQPEAAAVLGATAGGIRYVLDGFALDPLVTPTFDPSRISLLSLERVRVERRVTGATVHLETLTPTSASPESVIEAATGDGDTNLFRGTFLAPRVLGGSLGLGYERLATDVGGGSNHTTAWVKWSFVRDSSGVQLELRQSDVDRAGGAAALVGSRSDWGVRARTKLGPIAAEVYAGATTVEDELGSVVLREGSSQGGLRLRSSSVGTLPLETTAALRLRSHPRLPRQELEVSAWLAPSAWLGLGGEAVQGWWDGSVTTGRWAARARLGPVLGVSAFGGIYQGGSLLGEEGAEVLVFGPDGREALWLDRAGARAGVEAAWGGFRAGAAAIRTEANSVPGFGLPFDSTAPSFGGGEATGMEATLRLPTPIDPIWLEGWYVSLTPTVTPRLQVRRDQDPELGGLDRSVAWLYLPERQWKAALVYHHSPLPSGNLELYTRIEHAFRDRMSTPAYAEEDGAEPQLAEVGAYGATNVELVIRVLSVRAFVRWDNVLHRQLQRDLPGPLEYVLPGQHITYGVKWIFSN